MVRTLDKSLSAGGFHGKQVLSEFDWTHCITKIWQNPNTREAKRSLTLHWMRWMEEKSITGPVDFEDINQYLYEHRASSMNMRKTTLRQILKRHPLIEYDLAAHMMIDQAFSKMRNVTPDNRVRQDMYMIPEEIDRILRQLYEADTKQAVRQACLFEALFQTAARCSELASFRHDQTKVFDDRVEIKVIGKRLKERTVFMTPLLYETIRSSYEKNDYLFVTRWGTPMTRQGIKQSILHLTRTRLGRPLGPHALRHSKAMDMKSRGVGVKQIQEYLGHSKPSTTIEYYFHDIVQASDVL